MPIKRYADFKGRSRRKEYWMFTLFQLICLAALFLLIFAVESITGDSELGVDIALGIGILGYLGLFFIPGIAVTVRRFHDQGKSGWFYLLSFIPYVGGIIMIVFMCIDGERYENLYGPDPKDESQASVFE